MQPAVETRPAFTPGLEPCTNTESPELVNKLTEMKLFCLKRVYNLEQGPELAEQELQRKTTAQN